MSEITRETIDALMAEQQHGAALAQLRAFFRQSPTQSNAQFVLDRAAKIDARRSIVTCRLFVLRSFTIEPMLPLLRASAFLNGLDVQTQVGDFNAYAQEILDPNSALYAFDPHAVTLAIQTRDLLPDLWTHFADCAPADIDAQIEQAVQNLRNWIGIFRSRSQAHLILHTLELPADPAMGVYDAQAAQGQAAAIQRVNRELQQIAREQKGVYLLDYDALIARYGRDRWHDARKWLTMRMPIAADALIHLADETARFLLPLMGRTAKALVVDLDNTLWGGVIGEDGLHGIKLSAEYPGAAFQQLQRAILDLYQRGIILAICSKNNHADAMEVFEQHGDMLLKAGHFAALRINWQDKAQNLREIAQELNIGLDALAFLDDNPVERQRVQSELPEVMVIDLPQEPMRYARALRDCPLFERLTLSAEDRERGRYYAEQRQRDELQQSAGSLEDFYRSLQMVATFAPVSPATLARVAQLTQKTNQFNLTTRRYSEQQISDLAASDDWDVLGLRVRDRFGDNGLVGVAILHHQGETAEIDTLLLSCRVIGRTIETALLAHLAERARAKGATTLQGWFLPTKKNTPAREFYATHGFTAVEERTEGAEPGTRWTRSAQGDDLAIPMWIEVKTTEAGE